MPDLSEHLDDSMKARLIELAQHATIEEPVNPVTQVTTALDEDEL
jgi:hypothetical protein